MSEAIITAASEASDLSAAVPITAAWVLAGRPESRSKELARSRDRTSYVMVWDCTAGEFNWHYNKDETLVVVSGEAFITCNNRDEFKIAPGDVVYFPAGSSARWRVPNYIRKVAFLRHTMPRLAAYAGLAWNLMLRVFDGSSGGL